MIPVHLDPSVLRIGVVGRGSLTLRRLHWLREGGAAPHVWSDAPEPALAAAAGPALRAGLPGPQEWLLLDVAWIADLEPALAAALAAAARAARVLVNVEDDIPLCDFHTPAVVRRGRLTLSAGTAGASPAAAQIAAQTLQQAFGPAWAVALEQAAAERDALRARGAANAAIREAATAVFARHGLTPARSD